MSRVLPFKKPTWDYSLWNEVRSKAASITEEDVEYLSSRDRGGSAKSNFWQKGGRRRNRDDSTKVIDFVGLSRDFDGWFTRVDLGRDGLLEEFQSKIANMKGADFLQGFNEEWVEINWAVLGRAIGSAIANEGKRRRLRGWKASGGDARMNNDFWIEVSRESDKLHGYTTISSEAWEDLVEFYREHGFDPGAEVVRSAGHRPSAPIFKGGSDRGPVYWMNPLTLQHRERMRMHFRGSDDGEEFARYHGELTFKALRDAMNSLKSGNEVKFALIIHGICSHHINRTNLMQQKIGMHLVTNLAVRRMTRGVEAVDVAGIAQALATGFTFGKVLEILYKSGIIEWYTVEASVVDEAISALKRK